MSKSNQGKSFENEIETIARHYAERQLLRVQKCEPPCRVIGWGPNRKVIFLPNPFLDFNGSWTERGGRAVHFEAKMTEKPRLDIGHESGGFTRKQFDAMEEWYCANAVTFLLWQMDGKVKFVTYEDICRLTEDGSKSIRWEDAGPDVPAGRGFIFYDFLAVMRERCIQ